MGLKTVMVTEGAPVLKDYFVACMTTNSLLEICKHFAPKGDEPDYQITMLKARATDSEEKQTLVDDDILGIKCCVYKQFRTFTMNYKLKWDDGTPTNPIDEERIRTIERYLQESKIEDAAVEMVQVLFRDSKLGKLAGVPEDLFHMTLISDPVDGDKDREKVKEHEVNKRLYKDGRFKYRILHCRELIGRKHELIESPSKYNYLILWRGKTALCLISPVKVAQRLRDEHFGDYRLLKKYRVEAEDKLVLIDVSR